MSLNKPQRHLSSQYILKKNDDDIKVVNDGTKKMAMPLHFDIVKEAFDYIMFILNPTFSYKKLSFFGFLFNF